MLYEYVSQNADLSAELEENGNCYEPVVSTVKQNNVAMEMTSLRNDDEEPEDVSMKESIVTNVSEGKPSDIRFELNEYMGKKQGLSLKKIYLLQLKMILV